jgi:hypothetical protein
LISPGSGGFEQLDGIASSANEVETADDNPISFASGEAYTLALLIRWTSVSGTQGILPLRIL